MDARDSISTWALTVSADSVVSSHSAPHEVEEASRVQEDSGDEVEEALARLEETIRRVGCKRDSPQHRGGDGATRVGGLRSLAQRQRPPLVSESLRQETSPSKSVASASRGSQPDASPLKVNLATPMLDERSFVMECEERALRAELHEADVRRHALTQEAGLVNTALRQQQEHHEVAVSKLKASAHKLQQDIARCESSATQARTQKRKAAQSKLLEVCEKLENENAGLAAELQASRSELVTHSRPTCQALPAPERLDESPVTPVIVGYRRGTQSSEHAAASAGKIVGPQSQNPPHYPAPCIVNAKTPI